jgi:hypothetical protein
LDAIPCTSSLQVDMEVWHWADCNVDYAVGTYWYGFGETTCNRGPDPKEAAQAVQVPPKATAAVPKAGKSGKSKVPAQPAAAQPGAAVPSPPAPDSKPRPNFVVILCDDL